MSIVFRSREGGFRYLSDMVLVGLEGSIGGESDVGGGGDDVGGAGGCGIEDEGLIPSRCLQL